MNNLAVQQGKPLTGHGMLIAEVKAVNCPYTVYWGFWRVRWTGPISFWKGDK